MVKIVRLQTCTKHYSHRDEAFLEFRFAHWMYRPLYKVMGRLSSLTNLLQFEFHQPELKNHMISTNFYSLHKLHNINLPDFAKNVKNPFNFLIFRGLDLIECTARFYIHFSISVKLLRSDF